MCPLAYYYANGERTTTAHLHVTVVARPEQRSHALMLLLLNVGPRLEQFAGDLLEMV